MSGAFLEVNHRSLNTGNSVFLEQYYAYNALKEAERKKEEEYINAGFSFNTRVFYSVVATLFIIGLIGVITKGPSLYREYVVNKKPIVAKGGNKEKPTKSTDKPTGDDHTPNPNPVDGNGGNVVYHNTTAPADPVFISIPKIGLEKTIQNPVSTENNILNEELKKGPVRYPLSKKLNENGNVLIFGHSALSVNDEYLRTFNGIQDLDYGDEIFLRSENKEYIYRVESVEAVTASEAEINLSTSQPTLTLSTCNAFGGHSARYVVKAKLVDQYSF